MIIIFFVGNASYAPLNKSFLMRTEHFESPNAMHWLVGSACGVCHRRRPVDIFFIRSFASSRFKLYVCVTLITAIIKYARTDPYSGENAFLHRNETSLVSLRLLDEGVRVQEAVYGHNYTLRAEISRPDGSYFLYPIPSRSPSLCPADTDRTHGASAVFPVRSSVQSTVLPNIQFAGTYGIRVKNCFAFNKLNSSVQLIDDKG